jgi:hypothetical protein
MSLLDKNRPLPLYTQLAESLRSRTMIKATNQGSRFSLNAI